MSVKPTIHGTSVILRPPRPEDAGQRLSLGRNAAVVRMFGGDTENGLVPLTQPEVLNWLHSLERHAHAWIVEHAGRLLGEVRLDGLHQHDRRARLAIGFYDPAKLGLGFGREAVRLVLRHAFGGLGLHRVDLRVIAYNERAIRCYRACGFVEEGRERESALVDGRRHDDVVMGILAREFHG